MWNLHKNFSKYYTQSNYVVECWLYSMLKIVNIIYNCASKYPYQPSLFEKLMPLLLNITESLRYTNSILWWLLKYLPTKQQCKHGKYVVSNIFWFLSVPYKKNNIIFYKLQNS